MQRCNLCKSITLEEAISSCAFEDCPHKQPQEAAPVEEIQYEITDEDLERYPELKEAGIQAGETVGIKPEEPSFCEKVKSFLGIK